MLHCSVFNFLLLCPPSFKTSKENEEEEELEEYEYEVGSGCSEWLIWEVQETLVLMWRGVTNLERFCGGC